MTEWVVQAEKLDKLFDDKQGKAHALKQVDFLAKKGKMTALIGPDGAGKTTTMRLICGLMDPTGGSLKVLGLDSVKDASEIQSRISYMPQKFGLYEDLAIQENMDLYADLHGVPDDVRKTRFAKLLDMTGLAPFTGRLAGKLSGGMKRRVGIAQAMLNDPKILVMDEPTAGLDPGERVRFRNFISEFSHDRIVLISTHIVSDIEYIATRNAIMKAGKIVDVGTTNELVKQIEGKVWNCVIPAEKLMDYEMRLHIINQKGEDNGKVSIRYLAEHSEIDGSVIATPRLEDLYLWLFPQGGKEKEEI